MHLKNVSWGIRIFDFGLKIVKNTGFSNILSVGKKSGLDFQYKNVKNWKMTKYEKIESACEF